MRIASASLLTFFSYSAHAAPPAQFREYVPEIITIPGYDLLPALSFIRDSTELARVETAAGEIGLARLNGAQWEMIREPVSPQSVAQTGGWYPATSFPSRVYLADDISGRIYFAATGGQGGTQTSLRMLEPNGNTWTERQIRLVPGTVSLAIANFRTSNVNGVAWVEQASGQESGDVWTHTAQGTQFQFSLDSYGYEFGARLNQYFDDGSFQLTANDGFGADVYFRSASGSSDLTYTYSVDIPTDFFLATNSRGDFFLNQSICTWDPVGNAIVQPFAIDPTLSEFKVLANGIVSPRGAIVFKGELDDSTSGLYIGPDPDADRFVSVGDSILGQVATRLAAFQITDRQQIYFRSIHDAGATEIIATLCPADMNRDAIFDNGDINAFVQAYLAGSLRADFTNDGLLDNGDIGEFVSQFLNAVSAGCG